MHGTLKVYLFLKHPSVSILVNWWKNAVLLYFEDLRLLAKAL
jgi:hypothetical protein